MTVTAQTPFNVSTANGVTTVFAYSFRILSEADIVVKVDGVTKTLTTDYTVTGVGAANGGTVVFGVAPANGTEVLRQRSISLARTNYDYQQSGDFLSATVNEDLDRIWMAMQGIDTDVGLSFRLPVTVSGWDTEIPEPTPDYAFFANAAGTGFEWRAVGSVALATPGDQTVTVAKMSASQTNVLFGRSTAGAGAGEEIPCTAAGRAILDDASADAQLATLGGGANGITIFKTATYAAIRTLLGLDGPVLISETNITAVSTLDFATAFSANPTYPFFKAVIEDMDLGNATCSLRVSNDGSTFLSSAAAYSWLNTKSSSDATAVSNSNSASTTSIELFATGGTASCNGEILFHAAANSGDQTLVISDITTTGAVGSQNHTIGSVAAAATATGFQIRSTGTFAAQGKVRIYGSFRPFS